MAPRRSKGLIWAFAVTCVASIGAAAAFAAAPHLDRGFGAHGVARIAFPPREVIEPFREITPASDGGVLTRSGYFEGTEVRHYGPDGNVVGVEPKVRDGEHLHLVAPEATTSDSGRLVGIDREEGSGAVVRYRPDGSPDDSFGEGGTSENLPFDVEAVAALPSGAALAAGKGILTPVGTNSAATYQVDVARLGPDGRIDQAFGSSGIVKLQSEDGIDDTEAVHLQGRGDGGAEVVTRSAAVALDRSGGLDRSFGKDGQMAMPGPVAGAASAADEALLVAGAAHASSGADGGGFYVARYTAAGKLDSTYAGSAGITVLDPHREATASAALFGADGTVSLGGALDRRADCPPGYSCDGTPIVVRFTADGAPYPGFGESGIVRFTGLTAPFETESVTGVEGLAARAGGGLFVSGAGPGGAFVAALGTDGNLDAGFGVGGFVTDGSQKTSYATPSATAADRHGHIYTLVESDSGTGLGQGAFVLRYLPDGRLDQSFGENGEAYVPPYSDDLAVTPDGSSYVTSSERSTLVRLTPSGSLDPTFGEKGSVRFPAGEAFEPGALAILADGDLLVGGARSGRGGLQPTVLRYRPDGKLDRSFGKGGIARAKAPDAREWEDTTAIVVDHRGGIVIAGSELRGCCAEPGTLVRFDRRGRLDRSFGRNGFTLLEEGGTTAVDLALRGRRILAVGGGPGGRQSPLLLYSFGADGRPDRGFADEGVAVVRPRDSGRESFETPSVFSIGHRIVVARSSARAPLVAFTPRGKLERSFARRLKGVPPRISKDRRFRGPFAAMDGNALALVWAENLRGKEKQGEKAQLSLQRVLLD